MTGQQYEKFKAAIEEKGYKLRNVRGTIHNEHFYYYKGFDYNMEADEWGYQIIFLVWDWSEYPSMIANADHFGVEPLIITDSHEWPRIDLQLTNDNFDVDKVEQYFHDFYYNFVLTHGL